MTRAELLDALRQADKGSPFLSTRVFMALGGIVRQVPTSAQGGELQRLPYWPGEKDPCMGISFTTNAQDCFAWASKHGIDVQLVGGAEGFSASFTLSDDKLATGRIKFATGHARTAALALSVALVAWANAMVALEPEPPT